VGARGFEVGFRKIDMSPRAPPQPAAIFWEYFFLPSFSKRAAETSFIVCYEFDSFMKLVLIAHWDGIPTSSCEWMQDGYPSGQHQWGQFTEWEVWQILRCANTSLIAHSGGCCFLWWKQANLTNSSLTKIGYPNRYGNCSGNVSLVDFWTGIDYRSWSSQATNSMHFFMKWMTLWDASFWTISHTLNPGLLYQIMWKLWLVVDCTCSTGCLGSNLGNESIS
jgi:hypothetical protein